MGTELEIKPKDKIHYSVLRRDVQYQIAVTAALIQLTYPKGSAQTSCDV